MKKQAVLFTILTIVVLLCVYIYRGIEIEKQNTQRLSLITSCADSGGIIKGDYKDSKNCVIVNEY